ncbi:hypothetical protein KAU15_04650 [candidate division WOR-3 bacterium]|nr:hypothetical protein [candidate division WOR-3 bacterium]
MYKHTQIGWLTLALLGIGILLIGYFGYRDVNVINIAVFWLLVLCVPLFATLTVVINEKFLEARFGIGLIKKKFEIKDIKSCTIVKNHWWNGWGIRKIYKGWLFNVSGLDAVELVMKNGHVYRVGTDDPEELSKAIQKELK